MGKDRPKQNAGEKTTPTAKPHSPGTAPVPGGHPLLRLQRQGGNQAVQELLRGRGKTAAGEDSRGAESDRKAPAPGRRGKPQCECGGSCPKCRARGQAAVRRLLAAGWIQAKAKLTVGRRDDPFEREADRVAAEVMGRRPCACSSTCRCGASDRGTLRRSPQSRAADGTQSAPGDLLRPLGSGRPLDRGGRAFFEPRFGRDLSAVRLHTGSAAATAAAAVEAHAFTLGRNIVLGAGHDPSNSRTRPLLAHELTHVLQQRPGQLPLTEGAAAAPPVTVGAASEHVQRSAASDLIDSHTSWGNLDEGALGAVLLARAEGGDYGIVSAVLDELGSTDRDDVSYEMIRRASDGTLERFAGEEPGRRMLDRLYDELTGGSVSDEERHEADRIMRAKSRRIRPEDYERGVERAKIFPFRQPGLTVFNDAPISAERRPGGKIWVEMPVRVLGTSTFRAETRTLPTEVFTSGIELPEDEIVGVKMYDLGGEVHYRPALYLVKIANEGITATWQTIGEVAALGLTFGTGALAGAGARAAWWVRALVWADRAAFAIGTLTTVIREHRGWIIERFGARGRTFLRYVDVVNSAVAIYGGVRAIVSLGQAVNGLRRSYNSWRAAAREAELAASEQSTVGRIARQTEDFLNNAEEVQRVRQAQSAAQAPAAGAGTGGGAPTAARPGLRLVHNAPRAQGTPTRASASTSSAYEGSAARQLAPAEAPAAPPRLEVVPDPVPEPLPAPAPTPAPAAAPVPAAPTSPGAARFPPVPPPTAARAAGRGSAQSPQQAPDPTPQPAPDEQQQRSRCRRGTVPILWPLPVWRFTGRQDYGATSGTYDRPPRRYVTKRSSADYDRNRTIIGEYVSENWQALRSYYPRSGALGAIHHKWPLYLGGPDRKSNFVFLTYSEHSAWHSALTRQTTGPVGTEYCIVNRP